MQNRRWQWALVPVIALALVACGRGDGLKAPRTRICVDDRGRRVADEQCVAPVAEGRPDANPVTQPFHRWYYVRQGKSIPEIGGSIHGGASRSAPAPAAAPPPPAPSP
ncbi:MAG TPA: hypothetical protein VGR07_05205 [Thermoanaerobaculia bacterium]|nr:hypothetical protein [Thermoanaerobaculia bacterium]